MRVHRITQIYADLSGTLGRSSREGEDWGKKFNWNYVYEDFS